MANIRVTGLREVLGRMANVAAAGRAANGPLLSVDNPRPYARFIETGRSSRQVRRAGPAWMARDGLRAALPGITADLAKALTQGPVQVGAAKGRGQQAAIREIQKRTPVQSGQLRAGWQPSGRTGGG